MREHETCADASVLRGCTGGPAPIDGESERQFKACRAGLLREARKGNLLKVRVAFNSYVHL